MNIMASTMTTTTTATSDWVLRARHLAFGYGRRPLFRDLSFDVAAGDILGIVGPNGSGKSTLLRTMLGLLAPLAGSIERRPGLVISYVPQRDRLDTSIPVTVLEVVLMGLAARAGALHRVGAAERAEGARALALLGDSGLAPRLFRNLSRGQQQRVLVARALAGRPDLLVLDEPTFGMDVAGEATMIEFLKRVNRERRVTIVVVTHMLPIVLNMASTIMLVGDRGILQGRVAEVLQEEQLANLYGVPVHLGTVAGRRTIAVGLEDSHV
jgi:ABC-type Mn2+/Zn2+ transport system ATPase subunit